MRNKNQLTKEINYNIMLFDNFALQPAYEHLLEGKKGAVLRISYCENFEKRERLRKLLTSHRLHGYHGLLINP